MKWAVWVNLRCLLACWLKVHDFDVEIGVISEFRTGANANNSTLTCLEAAAG